MDKMLQASALALGITVVYVTSAYFLLPAVEKEEEAN